MMPLGRRFLDRLTSWSPVLLLGGLAALTYWLDAQVQQPLRRDATARHDPDLYAEGVRAVTFGTDGRVQQSLAAARVEHFPDDNGTEFTAPAIVLTDPGHPRLAVTADRGRLSSDQQTVVFNGNVRAVRDPLPAAPEVPKGKGSAKAYPGADGGGPVTVTTQSLRVVPKLGRADTQDAVTIEEPRGIIRAVGMEFDNQAKTLKLHSSVRGTLQPRPLAK
jgi:lipopolysaccharide export system protein LptC